MILLVCYDLAAFIHPSALVLVTYLLTMIRVEPTPSMW